METSMKHENTACLKQQQKQSAGMFFTFSGSFETISTEDNIVEQCQIETHELLSASQGPNVCTVCSTASHLDFDCCHSFLSSCDASISTIDSNELCDDQSVVMIEEGHHAVDDKQEIYPMISWDIELHGPATIVSSSCSSSIHCIQDDNNGFLTYLEENADNNARSDHQQSLDISRVPSESSGLTDAVSLSSLPDEILCSITNYLDVRTLVRMRSTSKRFMRLASRDEAGWSNHCSSLWKGKVHVCDEAKSLFSYEKQMAFLAYKLSRYDGRYRHEIKENELCFDASAGRGIVWSFRFKEKAGVDWTSWDPWWNGHEARKMVFLQDGRVMELSPLPHNSETYNTCIGGEKFAFLHPFADTHVPPVDINSTDASLDGQMSWRFITQPMDLPSRPSGAYIRLNIGGRDVPTYIVHRSPTGNWGFVLESCWGVYASFDLPKRQIPASVMRNVTRGRTRMRLRRTREGARWMNVDGIESDSEDEDMELENNAGRLQSGASLLDDSSLAVTNGWQWREALLYNFGAGSLPEGQGALQEFNRVWWESIQRRQRFRVL